MKFKFDHFWTTYPSLDDDAKLHMAFRVTFCSKVIGNVYNKQKSWDATNGFEWVHGFKTRKAAAEYLYRCSFVNSL